MSVIDGGGVWVYETTGREAMVNVLDPIYRRSITGYRGALLVTSQIHV